MPFIPHTEDDIRAMLAAIGAPSIEALFDEIPQELRTQALARVPPGLSELEIGRLMTERAKQDGRPLSFLGAGAYEHHIPSAVWAIVTRGEIYSAYTPYQAEASQGTLQAIYEYQTMIASLTGMQVSNATLYDGGSALAEAALMAVRAHRKSSSQRILVPTTVHPHYRKVAVATAGNQGLVFDTVPYVRESGCLAPAALAKHAGEDITALVIQQPNFFGMLEDVDALTDWAHAQGALVIAVVNPTSLALLKPPGEWGAKGADIVVGEGQPLGVPLSSGGPYFGFMTTRMEHVRQMPGRIVGRTVDLDGREGFALTLQAREQHIRRGKATSNICTNQGLLMTAATIYMSIMGPRGSSGSPRSPRAHARAGRGAHCREGRAPLFRGAAFPRGRHRARPAGRGELRELANRGILGGFDLSTHYPELGAALLVCATEMRTAADIERYAGTLTEALPRAADTETRHAHRREKLIFEYSRTGRGASGQWPDKVAPPADIPAGLLIRSRPLLPEVSELEAVRHYTRLSQLNFSIDTHFYPLGSCTMKYNPKACNQYAMLPEFTARHPLGPESHGQGFRLHARTAGNAERGDRHARRVVTPRRARRAAGVAMIRAYHRARGDLARNEIIVPEARTARTRRPRRCAAASCERSRCAPTATWTSRR